MRLSQTFRAALIALMALAGLALSSTARADNATIRFSVIKAGWFVGGSGGSGTLYFRGRRYRIGLGGISAGFVFGASETRFSGTVSNIYDPRDIEGVYGAVGAGAAAIRGAQAIVLQNEKGVLLRLSGRQVGLQINADISGLAINLR
ncbi:MAG: hypothetical protein AB7K64_21275 [Variibacter sp.]